MKRLHQIGEEQKKAYLQDNNDDHRAGDKDIAATESDLFD